VFITPLATVSIGLSKPNPLDVDVESLPVFISVWI
jgi:hypothetical protein